MIARCSGNSNQSMLAAVIEGDSASLERTDLCEIMPQPISSSHCRILFDDQHLPQIQTSHNSMRPYHIFRCTCQRQRDNRTTRIQVLDEAGYRLDRISHNTRNAQRNRTARRLLDNNY